MTLSEWINHIRWKYFTNNKAGLIFKEIIREFEMVDKMTENKRYTYLNYSRDGHIGSFYLNDKPITNKEVWDLLNEQDERIETLKEDVEIILDYVLNKGKFAMTVKEQKAHNRLRGFVRGDVE